jgi:asparagine synthase (glutamine-hydrolysing)
MFRFIGVVWNERIREHAVAADALGRRLLDSAPDWIRTFEASGLHIYCAGRQQGSDGILELNGQGMVLGSLRRRVDAIEGRAAAQAHLDATQCREIIDSQGKALIEAYWGNYVAVLGRRSENAVRILKDPTGSLPCFLTTARGMTLVFSCVADLAELGFSFTPNVSYLESRLILESNPNERDALAEVSHIYGGECLCIDYGSDASRRITREFYWTPSLFTESDRAIEDPAQAAEAMRCAVSGATHSLAREHDSLLLRLSGGLDSSIVAGCLRDLARERHVICYTYFTPRGRSSELPWARLAAAHCGLAHVERPVAAEDLELSLLRNTAPTVNPSIGLMRLQKITLEKQLIEATGATGVFSGDGGDGVFGSHSITHALTDQLVNKGIGSHTLRLASGLARAKEMSTLALVVRALREWISGESAVVSTQADLQSCVLVNEDLRRKVGRIKTQPHPWFRNSTPAPGLPERLGALLYTVEHYFGADRTERQAEELAPLYSQPVIETLLRIPLYVLCEGGRDRALARRAFAQEVPAPILRREWKDRSPGLHYQAIQRCLPFLREMLLDGVLVRAGWLNRTAVERALSGDPTRIQVYPGEILGHLDTEIWARHWLSPARYSAAA